MKFKDLEVKEPPPGPCRKGLAKLGSTTRPWFSVQGLLHPTPLLQVCNGLKS